MRLKFIVLFLSALLISTICYGQQIPPWNLWLQFPYLDGLDEVATYKNILYYSGSPSFNKLDIYTPKEQQNLPIVFLIHGGPVPENIPVKPKDWEFFKQYGKLLANNGLAAVVINHSLFSNDNILQSRQDIENAISFIKENASNYGINGNMISLWMFSFGAIHFNHFAAHQNLKLEKIVSFYGFFNDEFPENNALPNQTQLLIIRCGKDNSSLLETTDNAIHHYIRSNHNISVINIPKAIHSFDLLQNNSQTERIISQTIDFLTH